MSDLDALLTRLAARGVRLTAAGDALQVHAPRGVVLDDELKEGLRRHKDELVLRLTPELSHSQRRLYFLERFHPEAALYNVAVAFRIHGRIDEAALAASLSDVVARHEALRTAFIEREGRPASQIAFPTTVPIRREPVAGADDGEILRRAEAFARQRFDLTAPPLVRAALFVKATDESIFVIAIHHLVFDAWSGAVFAQDLATAYAARVSGAAPAFAALPANYTDFVRDEAQRLGSTEHASALERVADRLAGVPLVMEVPLDFPRPRLFTTAGATFTFQLEGHLTAALHELGRSERATPFMVLLAAFGALMRRATLAERFVIGTPTSGRYRREHEALVGLFADLAPVVIDARDEVTFRQLLVRVRDEALATIAGGSVPFDAVIDKVKPPRDPSRPPLVQVAFAYQNAPRATFTMADLRVQPIELDPGTARFDLMLSAVEAPAGGGEGHLALSFEYRTDLFEPRTIARFADALVALIEDAVRDPNTRVDCLRLSARPPAAVTALPPPTASIPRLVHERFAAHAQSAPHAPAVTFEGTTISYAALDDRANRIAHALRAAGATPGSLVGVSIAPCIDMVAALVATAKLGVGYVPLDPEHPAPRLAALATRASVRVIVTSASAPGTFTESAPCPVVAIDDALIAAQPRTPANEANAPEAAAYVMFTSGSTGEPKGVIVSRANVARLFEAGARLFDFRADDTWSLLHSVGFDFSVWELWGALAHGGRLVVAPRAVTRAADSVYALLDRERVTVLSQTPSAFSALGPMLARGKGLAVRAVVFGGEALDVASLAPFLIGRDPSRRIRFINMYGITEITVHATWKDVTADTAMLGRASPIGAPWPDLTIDVVDAAGRSVPDGFPGELWISGPGVTDGYFQDPALTAQRFASSGITRTYKSGDMGRRVRGELYFLGRADAQIKLRGHRIELGEIEAALRDHPAVTEVAVTLRREPPYADALVGYVVLRDPSFGASALRDHARARLPAYMVPAVVVPIAALPLTPNGKLDRSQLPAPPPPASKEQSESESSATARAVAGIWCDVLGLASVPHDESFFDLGGSSLRLVEVQTLLEIRLARKVPLVELFEFPTVAALATHLDASSANAEAPTARANRSGRDRIPAREPIAIVGMACRFPSAPSLVDYWTLLEGGRSATRDLTDADLDRAGVPDTLRKDARYVRRANVLDDVFAFDAVRFGYSPAEAALLDPQQRVFLECVWHALEDAGISPQRDGASPASAPVIGLYAGASMSRQMLANMGRFAELQRMYGDLALLLANDKDYVATRVAYELDLRGPAVSVQTACSTSLVAIHEAACALLRGEVDVALAGGVSVDSRPPQGYLYREGGIASPDGHCRAFDDDARGTVAGSGAGVVVLKRLSDALANGDGVYAVLLGTATNNDGRNKVGFTAPSVAGQAEVITTALDAAGVPARSIGYVEGHGTATPLGDPIEIAALTRAYRAFTTDSGFALLGSVKSNIGHLDAAAGVAGFIKAVLAVHHGVVPPTLHVARPSKALADSPFRAASTRSSWPEHGSEPRRAAVSSFGLGGTNAHAILEQAPAAARKHDLVKPRTEFARTVHELAPESPRPATNMRREETEFCEAVTWQRSPQRAARAIVPIAIFGAGEMSQRIVAALERRGATVMVAERGASSDDVRARVEQLRAQGGPARCVWMHGLAGDAQPSLGVLERDCLVGPLDLARTLTHDTAETTLDLVVLTDRGARALGNEPIVAGQALVRGLALTLPLELPGANVRTIDIADASAEAIADELLRDTTEARVALRAGARWIPARLPLRDEPQWTPRAGSVAWIAGGLGDLGVSFAETLGAHGVSLVLLGRTPLPPVAAWREWLAGNGDAKAARAVRRLLESGIDLRRIAYETVDVADENALRALLARAPFGKPNIVIHAAGVAGGGLALRRTPEQIADVLGRARGAIALANALSEESLDALVFCSALSAHVGAVGQLDVIAAAAVMEAVAESEHARRDGHAIAIAWPAWKTSRMAQLLEGRYGVSDDEGKRALLRLLGAPAPCVLVSPEPIDLLEKSVRLSTKDALAHLRGGDIASRAASAPSSEVDLEAEVTAAFRAILGVDELGPDDDFFDLGGDSMLALAALADLETRLGRTLAAGLLVTGGSVRSVTTALRAAAAPAPTATTAASSAAEDCTIVRAGSDPSVVLVHAVAGTLSSYRELVERMPRDVAIYGLSSPELRIAAPRERSIDAIADDHVRALTARAPTFVATAATKGCVVVGWSFGAILAFEIGRRLQVAGARVHVVAIDMALVAIAANAASTAPLTPLPAIEAVHRRAMETYAPQPVASDTLGFTLIRARSGPFAAALGEGSWGWEQVLGSAPHTVTLEGDHEGVLRAPSDTRIAALVAEARASLARTK